MARARFGEAVGTGRGTSERPGRELSPMCLSGLAWATHLSGVQNLTATTEHSVYRYSVQGTGERETNCVRCHAWWCRVTRCIIWAETRDMDTRMSTHRNQPHRESVLVCYCMQNRDRSSKYSGVLSFMINLSLQHVQSTTYIRAAMPGPIKKWVIQGAINERGERAATIHDSRWLAPLFLPIHQKFPVQGPPSKSSIKFVNSSINVIFYMLVNWDFMKPWKHIIS